MRRRINLRYTDDLPAAPELRRMENLALADRRSFETRFGAPLDPRRLVEIYDVCGILETYADYEAYFGRRVQGTFDGLERWSGLVQSVECGDYLMLINPDHQQLRRTLTIAHEFGHIVLGHQPITVEDEGGMRQTRYSELQEGEAYAYGLALLLPYAPLLQILEQHASLKSIARHYGVSLQAVQMRLKLTGLWGMR